MVDRAGTIRMAPGTIPLRHLCPNLLSQFSFCRPMRSPCRRGYSASLPRRLSLSSSPRRPCLEVYPSFGYSIFLPTTINSLRPERYSCSALAASWEGMESSERSWTSAFPRCTSSDDISRRLASLCSFCFRFWFGTRSLIRTNASLAYQRFWQVSLWQQRSFPISIYGLPPRRGWLALARHGSIYDQATAEKSSQS